MQTIPANELLAGLDSGRAGAHPRCCDRQPQGGAGLRVRLLPR